MASDSSNYILFWHEYEENGQFSNWYPSPFIIENFCYRHAEQYIMAEKAKLFHDAESYTAILRADTPKECKNLGRLVKGFDADIWKSSRYRILMAGLRAKFLQNSKLKESLIATGNAVLAEASPYDNIFGIGITAAQAKTVSPSQWPGENLLGNALVELRSEICPASVPTDRSGLAQELTHKMLNAPKYTFSNLTPSAIPDGLAGVYAITNQRTGKVLYVGRTKNLRQRLYNNHLMGPISNARLKKYLMEDSNLPLITDAEQAKKYLKDNCYFQYLPEPDVLKRAQLEGLLSFMLNVKYMHEEH